MTLFELTLYEKQLRGLRLRLRQPPPRHPPAAVPLPHRRPELDELVTRTYTLKTVNDGYQDMFAGRNIRGR